MDTGGRRQKVESLPKCIYLLLVFNLFPHVPKWCWHCKTLAKKTFLKRAVSKTEWIEKETQTSQERDLRLSPPS